MHPSIAVVHLFHRRTGINCFERFIHSYRTFPDPLMHDLIVLFKGFDGGDSTALSYLEGIDSLRVDVRDEGFDIGPYLEFAQIHDYDYYCFLNSFSVILAEEWLSKLYEAITTAPRAGIVGASGSWETIEESNAFPNYHIRTTAFLISGPLLRAVDRWEMHTKHDTSLFEAGAHSLTNQVLARDLEPYVVDRWGQAWAKEDWPRSNTYRSGEQDALLIGDKRTDSYRTGRTEDRTYLSKLAWTNEHPGVNPFKRHKLSRRLRRWFANSPP